jgi:hypothetical protein
MVVFVLYVKADLKGIASVALVPGKDVCISVRNPIDDTEVREKIVIDSSALEESEKVGGELRGLDREPPCHFALKWQGANKRSTIQVLNGDSNHKQSGKKGHATRPNADVTSPRVMLAEDSGTFVPMLTLECQGLEPYAFHPMGTEFVVTNSAGVTKPVDLSGGSWSEYDLGSGSTFISNFETKFV